MADIVPLIILRDDAVSLKLVTLPAAPVSVVGRLAARAAGAPLTSVEQASEQLELRSLVDVSLLTLRAPTRGRVAFFGL